MLAAVNQNKPYWDQLTCIWLDYKDHQRKDESVIKRLICQGVYICTLNAQTECTNDISLLYINKVKQRVKYSEFIVLCEDTRRHWKLNLLKQLNHLFKTRLVCLYCESFHQTTLCNITAQVQKEYRLQADVVTQSTHQFVCCPQYQRH